MAINRHLLHVKSNQTVTTTVDNEDVTRAKLPSPSNIEHGEIAINYHDGYETISIKNDNNEIVEFPNLNAVNILINEAMSGAQDALTFDETPTENSTNPVTSEGIKEYVDTGDSIQSLTTYQSSTPLAVGDTHDQALSKLSKIIDDNETVVARALTELEDTKADKDDLYTKDEVDSLIEETNDSLTQIIEDNELTIATALNDLDSRISNMKGSIEELNEPSESTPLAVGDTYDDAFAKLTKIIRDDEEITARALTDLNETKQDEITDLDTIRSGAALGATALQSETQLSKGTATGDGNVVTDIAVNNHQITLTMGLTALTENALKTVNSLSLIGSGNIDAEDVIFGKLVEGSGMLAAKNFYRFNGTYSQKPTDIVPSPDFSDTAETPNDKKIYVDILTKKIYWHTSNSGIPAGQRFKELCEVDLSSYADGAEYDSTEKKIYLKHGATRLSNPIDATDFIKDGMVNSVRIDMLDDGSSDDGSDGYEAKYLIITFNTDAGMEDIEIPLSDIFDPNLYYTKEEIDEHELVTAAALTDLHNTKQDLLTFDSTPTANSTNPVTSGGVYAALSNINTDHLTEVTYSELKTLRDGDELVPGMFYRITDYQCTTTQANTQSADHQFDIVLLALSENKVAEEGWAMHHANDTYFANSNLSAWKVWYCLDNNKVKYSWADTTNGKGVIYRMIDEWGNDVPYDFKNIQFKRKLANGQYDPTSGTDTWVYTFNAILAGTQSDNSLGLNLALAGGSGIITTCAENVIKPYYDYSNQQSVLGGQGEIVLNNNVFLCNASSLNSINYLFVYGNKFDVNSMGNTFKDATGENIFGSDCMNNTFGHYCMSNIVGKLFIYNTIKYDFSTNVVGNDVRDCQFNDWCTDNKFGNNIENCVFGNPNGMVNSSDSGFYHNTIDNNCYQLSLIGDIGSFTIGNGVHHFYTTEITTNNVIVENGVSYVTLDCPSSDQFEKICRNITIAQGVSGSSSAQKIITHPTVNDTIQTIYRPTNSQVVSV